MKYPNEPTHTKYIPRYVAHIEVDILYQLYRDVMEVEIWFQWILYVEAEVFIPAKLDLYYDYKENLQYSRFKDRGYGATICSLVYIKEAKY